MAGPRFALAAAIVAAIALVGCGGGGRPSTEAGPPGIDVPLRLADCDDWKAADVAARLGTVRDLREFSGGPVPGTGEGGPVIDDQEAYDLLERTCEQGFAGSFTLYRIYVRAASFRGGPDPDA